MFLTWPFAAVAVLAPPPVGPNFGAHTTFFTGEPATAGQIACMLNPPWMAGGWRPSPGDGRADGYAVSPCPWE